MTAVPPSRVRARNREALARYLIVGVISFAVDYGVLMLAFRGFHSALWVATAAGFWVSFVVNFLLSRHWTFEARHHPSTAQLWRYGVLVAANSCVTLVAVPALHHAGAAVLIAKGLVVGVLTLTTFAAYRTWVFPQDGAR